MSIVTRIRAHGGEVIREGWQIKLRPGQMTAAAVAWVAGRKEEILREVWPEYDDWQERAAIMEFDGGMTRAEAEAAAYERVMQC